MMTNNNEKDKRFSKLLSTVEKGKVLPDKQFLAQLRDKSAKEFETYSAESEGHSLKETISIWRIIMKNKITKLAVAAVILVAGFIGINQFRGPISLTSVAWAEVVEKFRSVSFYNAVLYFKEDAASEPKQIELWVSSEHKARIRVYSQVLFAENGKISAGYNFRDRILLDESQYDQMGETIIEKLFQRQTLSLDNIVEMVYKGDLMEMTPQINPDAIISEDLLVFDLDSTISPEWMRIWALRESKLPIRLRMWDPRDGGCMDVIVTYEKQQPAQFFDSNKYEELLLSSTDYTHAGKTNLAYAFLQDPGGKDYVPQDLFNKSGYHMPVVERIGMTEYGAVWVVASKAQNRRPDAYTFDGFSTVTDNLGRTYKRTASRYLTGEDVSAQVFVPEGYPFDLRLPDCIQLTCEVEKWHPDEPKEIIGTLEFSKWEQSSEWPQKHIRVSQNGTFLTAAHRFINNKEYDKADRIVQMIQATPDADQVTHELNKLELKKLIHQEKFGQADSLAEQMWPVELNLYINTNQARPNVNGFANYIIAIAANGRVDRSAELWRQLKNTEPDISRFSKGAQKHMKEAIERQFTDVYFVYDLFSISKLNLEQVNKILGFDVLQNENTEWRVPEKYRR